MFLDCKLNADVAALCMSEFGHFEARATKSALRAEKLSAIL
jgi:hypothetical protein